MSRMQIVYVTGLGDQNVVWQRRVVKAWRLYGVEPHFFQVRWADDELFEIKLEIFLKYIDKLYVQSGRPVGVVAVSAGVSMALHAFSRRSAAISGVVSICGKIQRPEGVIASIRRKNPAFSSSMDALPDTCKRLSLSTRARILCLYPFTDHIVPVEDAYFDGAQNRRAYSFGHACTIAIQLTVGAWKNVRFLKRQLI